MKKNEFIALFFIALFAGVIVYVISNSIFKLSDRKAQVEVVNPIENEVEPAKNSILLDKNRVDLFSDVTLNQTQNQTPFSNQ
jgi:hypothetical protein